MVLVVWMASNYTTKICLLRQPSWMWFKTKQMAWTTWVKALSVTMAMRQPSWMQWLPHHWALVSLQASLYSSALWGRKGSAPDKVNCPLGLTFSWRWVGECQHSFVFVTALYLETTVKIKSAVDTLSWMSIANTHFFFVSPRVSSSCCNSLFIDKEWLSVSTFFLDSAASPFKPY